MKLFKNVYLLYLIFLLAILNITWFLYRNDYNHIIIFTVCCLVIYLVNKNMIFVLGISIIIVDLLYLVIKKEGFKEEVNDDEGEDEGQDEGQDENLKEDEEDRKVEEHYEDYKDKNKNNVINYNDNEDNKLKISKKVSQDSEYMQDKSIITKLQKMNPIVLNEIQNMNSKEFKELNDTLNQLNSLQDP